MKQKIYSFLTLLTAFLWLGTGTMWGDEVTVGDETSTNYSVPICAYYFDMGFHTQIVYLKGDLSAISGGTITGLTFYSSTASQTWTSGATVNVKLMETDADNFTSTTFTDVSAATTNYTGQFNISENKVTITLSSEFEYSGDGNLLVDINMASSSSTTPSIAFYGTARTGSSLSTRKKTGSYSYNLGIVDFYPKTTFEYTAAAPVTCAKPTTVEVAEENIGSNSATITLAGLNNATVEYKKKSATDYSVAKEGVTGTSYLLENLDSYTEYDIQVKNVCGGTDGESKYVKASFRTKCGATSLPINEDFSAELTSCWTLRNTVSGTGVTSGYFTFKYTKSPSEYLITPEIAVTGNPVKVEFDYWKATSGTEIFSVGYSTTTNETDAFTWGTEVTATNTSSNKKTYSETLPANVKYVAIKYSSNDQYYLYIDNFSLVEDVLPACPKPTALSKSAQTKNSATLSWTENGSATSWNVQYSTTSDFSDDNHTVVANTNTSYVLSGLDANKHYYVHVQAACEGDYSDAIDFTTDCDAQALPLEEDFSGAITCWTKVDCHSETGVTSGEFKFRYSTTPPQYLISPELEASANGLQVEFDYRVATNMWPESFVVGYSTTTKAISEFAWGTELIELVNTSYTHYSEILPAGVKYVAIQYTANDKSALFIDNFTVSEYVVPSCAKPTALNEATNITPEGATFTWEGDADYFQYICVAGGTAEGDIDWTASTKVAKAATNQVVLSDKAAGTYDFYVRSWCDESAQSEALKKSFTTETVAVPTIGTITTTNNSANASWTAPTGISYCQWSLNGTDWSEPTSELSAVITSLEQNTNYTFYVRSYYDATHQSAEVTKDFTTECDPIAVSAAEYAETFDDITSGIPACWKNNEGTTTTESYKWNSAASGQSGRCVRFESKENGTGKTNILASPLFELNADADLSFYVKNFKGGDYKVQIAVDGGAREDLFTDLTNIQNWTKKEAALTAYNGHTIQFFFCGTSNWSGNSNGYLYLDEFKITPAACRKPASRPVASDVTANSATLTWGISPAAAYQYSLVEAGNAPAWEDIDTNTKTFDNLQPTTTYDFAVRSACGGADFSDTLMVSFRTDCGTYALPFEENFNSLAANAIPECWSNAEGTSTDYYKWKGYTYGGTEGTNCVRFNSSTNDNGNTNVLATPTIQLGEDNLLTFYAKNPTGGDLKVQIQAEGEERADLMTGLTGLADWTLKYVAIPAAYNNKKVQILFCATSNEGDENAYIYLDNVRVAHGVALADNANNSAIFSAKNGQTLDVVTERTIVRKGYYNTICLPFDLSAEEFAASPIASNDLWAFKYAKVENNELLFRIIQTDHIEAGVPYFIGFENNDEDIVNPFFENVTISATVGQEVGDDVAKLCGIIDQPVVFEAGDQTKLFLAANNTLYWWNGSADSQLNNFRAYFKVATGGNNAPIRHGMRARIIKQEEVATGVENVMLNAQTLKLIENGNVVIIRNGVKYNIQGQVISK